MNVQRMLQLIGALIAAVFGADLATNMGNLSVEQLLGNLAGVLGGGGLTALSWTSESRPGFLSGLVWARKQAHDYFDDSDLPEGMQQEANVAWSLHERNPVIARTLWDEAWSRYAEAAVKTTTTTLPLLFALLFGGCSGQMVPLLTDTPTPTPAGVCNCGTACPCGKTPTPDTVASPADYWESLAAAVERGSVRDTGALIAAGEMLRDWGRLPDTSRLESFRTSPRLLDTSNRSTVAQTLRGGTIPSPYVPISVSPFPADRPSVLIVCEMTGPQPDALQAAPFWLSDAVPDRWGLRDDDLREADLVNEAKWVRDAYAVYRAKYPSGGATALLVGGPRGGTFQSLPATFAGIQAAVTPYL